jgi:hypothetical protein
MKALRSVRKYFRAPGLDSAAQKNSTNRQLINLAIRHRSFRLRLNSRSELASNANAQAVCSGRSAEDLNWGLAARPGK